MIYHRDIGFPKTLVIPEVTVSLGYTRHAQERKNESYKLMVVPTVVKIQPSNVVEAHTDDNINITKVLVRINYNKTQDMLLVLQPILEKGLAKVITLWVNNKRDVHKTLKKQYDKPCDM